MLTKLSDVYVYITSRCYTEILWERSQYKRRNKKKSWCTWRKQNSLYV